MISIKCLHNCDAPRWLYFLQAVDAQPEHPQRNFALRQSGFESDVLCSFRSRNAPPRPLQERRQRYNSHSSGCICLPTDYGARAWAGNVRLGHWGGKYRCRTSGAQPDLLTPTVVSTRAATDARWPLTAADVASAGRAVTSVGGAVTSADSRPGLPRDGRPKSGRPVTPRANCFTDFGKAVCGNLMPNAE